ncbi:MAG: c-type cytochrome domain-containing protein [Luteolibacter sp.]
MADKTPSIASRRKPWALTFFGLLAAGCLIAMPFLAGPVGDGEMPDIMNFIGRFHPVLLHLPIGVFVLIVFQEIGAILRRSNPAAEANSSLFPLFFGAASSVLAVIAGFLLFQSGEYVGNEIAERHLWSGLIFSVLAILTFLLKAWTVAMVSSPKFYRGMLFVSVGLMGFASHDGASLTHGESYLTDYAPDPVRQILGLEKKKKKDVRPAVPLAGAVETPQLVYADIVAPILEQRCVQCHKEGKAKGKFRMDTYELLVKGGSEGPGLVAGNAAESSIIVRIELPEDDEEHMPPEGKQDIKDPDVAILKWWIDNGADPKKSLADFEVPAAIQEAISKLVPASLKSAQTAESADPHAAPKGPDSALVAAVAGFSKDFPGAVSFESQQSALVTFTAVSLRGNLDDAGFKKLAPITPQLVTVDLSATKITDQAVAQLASAKDLRLIRLAETGITDAAIDTLLKLPNLESINLFGTKVTDQGVSKLSSLPNLKYLYLWQTAVTPEAIKALKEKLPACQIITGIDS